MKYKRPHIPYEGKAMPNNMRYQILTQNHQAPTAEMLDGEMNYCIDSMNALDKSIEEVVLGKLPGSDNPANANKLLTTNGDEENPTLSWVRAGQNQIQDGEVLDRHIRDRTITTEKYENLSVTNNKIDNDTLTHHKIANTNDEDKAAWAAKIATDEAKANTIVSRDHNGVGFFSRARLSATDDTFNFPKMVVTDQNNVAFCTTVAKVKQVLGISDLANRVTALEQSQATDELAYFKKYFPVGCVYITYTNQNPPFHNAGVTWTAIAEGMAIMTASGQNTGTTGGANRLDTGTTGGTALNVNQIPAHNHVAYTAAGRDRRFNALPITGGDVWYAGNANTNTTNTGGGQAHTHPLNITNQKLLFWRRTA